MEKDPGIDVRSWLAGAKFILASVKEFPNTAAITSVVNTAAIKERDRLLVAQGPTIKQYEDFVAQITVHLGAFLDVDPVVASLYDLILAAHAMQLNTAPPAKPAPADPVA